MADRPKYDVFCVEKVAKDDKSEEAIWTKVGAAWEHRDGKGITVQLRALPVNASIILREPKDDKDEKPTNNRR